MGTLSSSIRLVRICYGEKFNTTIIQIDMTNFVNKLCVTVLLCVFFLVFFWRGGGGVTYLS